MKSAAQVSGVMLALLVSTGPALADDPLGLYLGGAVGRSLVRGVLNAGDCVISSAYYCPPTLGTSFSNHVTAWKASVGIRPLSILGAEAEYIDFGSSGDIPINYFNESNGTALRMNGAGISHQRAAAAFAVGYLPIPVVPLEPFAKVGAAALMTHMGAAGSVETQPICQPGADCFPTFLGDADYSVHDTRTRFAYGAGVQTTMNHMGARVEYERISAPGGGPDFLSLGVFWKF